MAMFQVVPDLENFKSFYLVEDDENLMLGASGYLDFGGKPKADWKGARVFMTEAFRKSRGKLPIPDIARFYVNTFAYSERAAELLKDILKVSGELLPLNYKGETWYIHNILNNPNVIDFEKSEYSLLDTGEFVYEKKVIDTSKLNDISLFTIKEENYSVPRCHEIDNKMLDYKTQIETLGLTGVKFLFPK